MWAIPDLHPRPEGKGAAGADRLDFGARWAANHAKPVCFGSAFRMSGKKWLPKTDSRGHLWSIDLERLENISEGIARNGVAASEMAKSDINRGALRDRAIAFVKDNGVVRTKDLEAIGVPRQYPRMMCKEGLLEQVGYGRYRVPDRAADTFDKVVVHSGTEIEH